MKCQLSTCLGLCLLAFPVLAEGDGSDQAIEILKKVDAATKAVSAVTYRATATPSGIAENFMSPAEGSITMEGWTGNGPERFIGEVKTLDPGSGEEISITAGGNGDMYFLINHGTKKAYEDMDPGVMGNTGRAMQAIMVAEFIADKPFDDELGADTVELQGEDEVDGEPCYTIRVVYAGGRGESIWSFSKNDYLPRKRIQMFETPQGKGRIERTITDVVVDPQIDESLFTLRLPDGYERIEDFAP